MKVNWQMSLLMRGYMFFVPSSDSARFGKRKLEKDNSESYLRRETGF